MLSRRARLSKVAMTRKPSVSAVFVMRGRLLGCVLRIGGIGLHVRASYTGCALDPRQPANTLICVRISRLKTNFLIIRYLYETGWFRPASVVALGLAGILLYRFRLHEVARRLNLLFEERLAERT